MGLYHLCYVVQDIQSAVEDLGRALGVTFRPVREGELGEWSYRIAFSEQGPPFFELVEGSTGSPWNATEGDRFDHVGFWSNDLRRDSKRLEERGAPVDFDARPHGRAFAYHRLARMGSRIELVDMSLQSDFLDAWSPGGAAMPAIDLDAQPGWP